MTLLNQEYIERLEVRIDDLEASVRNLKRLIVYRSPQSSSNGIDQYDQLLTVNDVIKLVGLPRHIIYAKAMSGEIPSFKIGKQYRFSRKKILEWFEGKFDKTADVDELIDKYLQKNLLSD
ncbi:MAG: helix-turn-helix domain-containing protein [Chitinophagaceae bacterium]